MNTRTPKTIPLLAITVSTRAGEDPDAIDDPHAFIQWKGTNVCMDFHCECGAHCHFDGDFAYTVQCPHCKTTWEMPFNVFPRKANEKTYPYWRENPKLMDADEDHVDDDGNATPTTARAPQEPKP